MTPDAVLAHATRLRSPLGSVSWPFIRASRSYTSPNPQDQPRKRCRAALNRPTPTEARRLEASRASAQAQLDDLRATWAEYESNPKDKRFKSGPPPHPETSPEASAAVDALQTQGGSVTSQLATHTIDLTSLLRVGPPLGMHSLSGASGGAADLFKAAYAWRASLPDAGRGSVIARRESGQPRVRGML